DGRILVRIDLHCDVVGVEFFSKSWQAEDLSFEFAARLAPAPAKMDQHEAVGFGGLSLGGLKAGFPGQPLLLGVSRGSGGKEQKDAKGFAARNLVHMIFPRRDGPRLG